MSCVFILFTRLISFCQTFIYRLVVVFRAACSFVFWSGLSAPNFHHLLVGIVRAKLSLSFGRDCPRRIFIILWSELSAPNFHYPLVGIIHAKFSISFGLECRNAWYELSVNTIEYISIVWRASGVIVWIRYFCFNFPVRALVFPQIFCKKISFWCIVMECVFIRLMFIAASCWYSRVKFFLNKGL